MHYSFFILISFSLLVGTFPEFLQNFFEKRQVASSRVSKEFCINPTKVLTYRKRGIALSCLQKSFENSKGFGVKQIRIFQF
jgi:K+-transporting ATPase A subunit